MSKLPEPRPVLGLVAGLIAGVAASAAMAAFQKRAEPLIEAEKGDGDPATVKAADKVSEAATGEAVPEPWRDSAGQVVHFVTGAALGALYGLIAEYQPEATKGFGTAYGAMTEMILDQAVVPAAGLGAPPSKTPPAVHAYGMSAHLVYGVALEGVRALIAGRRLH